MERENKYGDTYMITGKDPETEKGRVFVEDSMDEVAENCFMEIAKMKGVEITHLESMNVVKEIVELCLANINEYFLNPTEE